MKALTLWQPWASLVACGAKWIETRSWRTDYRGLLAIHAAARPPDASNFGGELGGWTVGRLDPDAPRRMWRTDVHEPPLDLPLGMIVAVCNLVDVVPIVDDGAARNCVDVRVRNPAAGVAYRFDVDGRERIRSAANQRPLGDFTPGRFAWILDHVTAFPVPVPCRGRQRLWTWNQ